MKISTKGRYALRMMLDLAEHQQDGFVALKDIAARQNISKKYLEQIVPILNKSNFLQANRGFQGGYRLVNAPREYTVGSILRLTEGNLTPVACLDFNPVGCERRNDCITFIKISLSINTSVCCLLFHRLFLLDLTYYP